MKIRTTLSTPPTSTTQGGALCKFAGCLLAITVFFILLLVSSLSAAAESDFLACARFADRAERIACLEDALEDALSAAGNPALPTAATPAAEPASQAAAANAAPAVNAARATNSVPTVSETAAASDNPSLLDRVRNFGKRVVVSTDDAGNERLHDTITALEKRNELWIVTLSSGQVWRQSVSRTMNLRVGDDIEIYQEGIGNGYRLSTPRLSGFIRVERVQ